MCGIAGSVALDARDRVDPEVVLGMIQAQRHRGPDGQGRYAWPAAAPRFAFGMRRLAIIDLETGDQPVFNETRQVAAICNGEIYNYVELRKALAGRGHVLQSRGDTEVLVHLYEEHGLDLFGHLRGMYAFAIWDAERERLVLAVDHLGIKPLYVCRSDRSLLFASDARALFAEPSVPRRLRVDAVDTFMTFGYGIGEDTLLDGISRLPPATALVVEGGSIRHHRHWRPSFAPNGGPAPDECARRVRETLDDAVRLHLRSDVPVGLFLSGGVDSAGLLALMRRHAPAVRTFTVGYADVARSPHDEASEAAALAAWAGASHCELRLSAAEWWQTLGAYVAAHEEPNANGSMVSLLALSRLAAAEVKVVLNGTGGDEMFGGYPAHAGLPALLGRQQLAAALPEWLRAAAARVLAGAEPAYPALRRWPLLARVPEANSRARAALLSPDDGLRRVASFESLVLTDFQRRRLYSPECLDNWIARQHAARTYRMLLEDSREGALAPEDVAQALIMRTWLPGNGLLAIDKVTMAHGLEARVPYFDRVFVEQVFALPASIRLEPGKALLRRALAADVPDRWRARRKQPFETPLVHWLDHDLGGQVRSVLLDPGARIRGLFNMRRVEHILGRHASRRAEHAELIFRLLVLELWWRQVLDR